MKAKDDVLAQLEREKIAEKQKEIRQMRRKEALLIKKHALIESKV